MTLYEFAHLPMDLVTPRIAAEVLHCAPYYLNIAAKDGGLPFPYFFSGNRLKISKRGVLEFLGYKEGDAEPVQDEAYKMGVLRRLG